MLSVEDLPRKLSVVDILDRHNAVNVWGLALKGWPKYLLPTASVLDLLPTASAVLNFKHSGTGSTREIKISMLSKS